MNFIEEIMHEQEIYLTWRTRYHRSSRWTWCVMTVTPQCTPGPRRYHHCSHYACRTPSPFLCTIHWRTRSGSRRTASSSHRCYLCSGRRHHTGQMLAHTQRRSDIQRHRWNSTGNHQRHPRTHFSGCRVVVRLSRCRISAGWRRGTFRSESRKHLEL